MPSVRELRLRLTRLALRPIAWARDVRRAATREVRRLLLRHRGPVMSKSGERYFGLGTGRRVLVAITHVVPPEALARPEERRRRLENFISVIDSVLRSFAQHEPELVVNTYQGRHLLEELPAYQRSRCRVLEHREGDPMLIEFAVQDLFIAERDRYDYFLFLEDDIAVHDPSFLDKIEEFNRLALAPDSVLLPHRFEMNDGRKYYVDRDPENEQWRGKEGSAAEDVVNPRTVIELESAIAGRRIAFAEFTNPHAACYCLSREQLAKWQASGRHWYRQVLWIGPLESAATGSLYEVFDLYKPHPECKWYLEVQHLDTKYSDRARRAREA